MNTILKAAGAAILIALASGCASLGWHDASSETLELQMARGSALDAAVQHTAAALHGGDRR